MRLAAKWTNDCAGKKDYDGSIVRVTTRYWPRGGGFHVSHDGVTFEGNEARPEIRPSAHSAIVLCHGEPVEGSPDGDYLDVIEREFEADTEGAVMAQVEAWAQSQFDRIAAALTREFATNPTIRPSEGK